MDRLILKYSEEEGYQFAVVYDKETETKFKDETFWEALKAFEMFLNLYRAGKGTE